MSDILPRLNELLNGRYRIERELGAGGMGTVYLAEDMKHARRVALKVLRPELTEMLGTNRFLDETRVTAALQHPHILPLFDSGEAGGLLFYVMPFVVGESLRERLQREGELPVADAARILRDVVEGLSAAHQQGVVHRDIKPENILLSGRNAVIADFGIAKTVSTTSIAHHRTTAGVALGTPAYTAPEQLTSDPHIDQRADIYAVGAVAYELLTGQPPFTADTIPQLLLAHLTEFPRPISEHRSSVPPDLEALVLRCLAKSPADRWQSADEMLPVLEAAAAGLAVPTSTPTSAPEPTEAPAPARSAAHQRRGTRSLALSAGVVVVVLAVWWISAWLGDAPSSANGATAVTPRVFVMDLASGSSDAEESRWSRRAVESISLAVDSTGAVDVVPQVALQEAMSTGPASAISIASRTAATHAMTVAVSRSDGRVEFRAEIVDLRSGQPKLLHSFGPVMGPADSAEAVIGQLARRAAAAVVLLFRGIALPLDAARVPASPEVISHLERASELGCELRYEEAGRELRRALAIDSAYIPALGSLAYMASAMGNWPTADSLSVRLDALRNSMLPRERLWWDYQRAVNAGDWASASVAAEKGYRDDPRKWGHVAGFVALSTRRVREALDRLLVAHPTEGCSQPEVSVFRLRAQTYHLLGRYDEELAESRRFLTRYPGNIVAMESAIGALAAQGLTWAVDSLLTVLTGTPSQPKYLAIWSPIRAALELRAHGHTAAAESLMRRAVNAVNPNATSVADREDRALALLFAERWSDADTIFTALSTTTPDSASYLRYHGVVLARQGRRAEALAVDQRLARIETRPRGLAFYYRAIVAAALGDARAATSRLEQAFRSGYGFDVRFHRDPWWDPVRSDSGFTALIRAL